MKFSVLLASGALIGLIGKTTSAAALSLSVDLNGVVIFTSTSTTPDQAVSANVLTLNSALAANGSAYQFTSLSAASDFPNGSLGNLTTNASLSSAGQGTTAEVLSIDVTQSGFTAPAGAPGQITSSASGFYNAESGALSFTSDYQGANTPMLVFPVSGTDLFSASTGVVPVGPIAGDYELSNHFLVSVSRSADGSISLTGQALVSAPEPGSIAMLGLGISAVLARRRRVR